MFELIADGHPRQLAPRQLHLRLALQEASLPFADADELADMIHEVFLPQLLPEEYPYLNESTKALMQSDYDPADEFTFGLSLVLDALERDRLSVKP